MIYHPEKIRYMQSDQERYQLKKTHWSLVNLSRSESKLTCIVGIASLRELKLSFIWSRRFLSSALWWARLSVPPPPPEPCRPLLSKKYALGLIYQIQLIKVNEIIIKTLHLSSIMCICLTFLPGLYINSISGLILMN